MTSVAADGGLGHPTPEELAALIDGGLSEEECARVRQHLSGCEECYDVFAETVRCLADLAAEADSAEAAEPAEDEDGAEREDRAAVVVPFRPATPVPERPPRRLPRWAAVAAAAALVLTLGPLAYRQLTPGPKSQSAKEMLAAIDASAAPTLADHPWPPDLRGSQVQGDPLETRFESFRLGVQLIAMQAGLRAGNRARFHEAAARSVNLLTNDPSVQPECFDRFSDLEKSGPDRSFEDLQQATVEAERELHRSLPLFDPTFFAFGKWTAAGRLAVQAGEPELLQRAGTRRFARRLLAEEGEQLREDGVEFQVRQIERFAARDDLKPVDREELVRPFERILNIYYPR